MKINVVGGFRMIKLNRIGIGLAGVAAGLAVSAGVASAQVVPNSLDPYELAPKGVHLYPISIDARLPFYYLPPIYAPKPMWRGAMTAEDVHAFAPHNYVVYEVPDTAALACWG